jgi:hypothetical protein
MVTTEEMFKTMIMMTTMMTGPKIISKQLNPICSHYFLITKVIQHPLAGATVKPKHHSGLQAKQMASCQVQRSLCGCQSVMGHLQKESISGDSTHNIASLYSFQCCNPVAVFMGTTTTG